MLFRQARLAKPHLAALLPVGAWTDLPWMQAPLCDQRRFGYNFVAIISVVFASASVMYPRAYSTRAFLHSSCVLHTRVTRECASCCLGSMRLCFKGGGLCPGHLRGPNTISKLRLHSARRCNFRAFKCFAGRGICACGEPRPRKTEYAPTNHVSSCQNRHTQHNHPPSQLSRRYQSIISAPIFFIP